ncbi:hypothetical protein C8J56DRAFT_886619 [Mycena floridula]|nr:hypothetical protein C8J56DRAFT_886619 [Mycena floridula]
MSPLSQSRLAFRKSRIACDALLTLLSFDDTVMMSRVGLPSCHHTYQTRKSQEIGRSTHRGQGKVFFLALGWVVAREPTAWWPPWQTLANVDNMFLTTEGHCTSRQRRMLNAQMTVVEGDRGGDVGGVTQRCDASVIRLRYSLVGGNCSTLSNVVKRWDDREKLTGLGDERKQKVQLRTCKDQRVYLTGFHALTKHKKHTVLHRNSYHIRPVLNLLTIWP